MKLTLARMGKAFALPALVAALVIGMLLAASGEGMNSVLAASEALPAWVPPPGNVAVLTNANGGLANHWRDVVAPYYSQFYAVGSVNDYSGAFKNPHWGVYGCTVFWGGGHAGNNHNAVHIAEYGASAITFKRVCDPTPWFGTGTDAQTQYDNSVRNANAFLNMTYMESTLDGKPGAPHSYGSGDIVGPRVWWRGPWHVPAGDLGCGECGERRRRHCRALD